jgi:hypothetical protein
VYGLVVDWLIGGGSQNTDSANETGEKINGKWKCFSGEK